MLIHIHHLHHLWFFFGGGGFASVVVGDWAMEFKEKIKDADGFCNSGTEVISWLGDTCHLFLMAPSIQSVLRIKCLWF